MSRPVDTLSFTIRNVRQAAPLASVNGDKANTIHGVIQINGFIILSIIRQISSDMIDTTIPRVEFKLLIVYRSCRFLFHDQKNATWCSSGSMPLILISRTTRDIPSRPDTVQALHGSESSHHGRHGFR